MRPLCVLLFPLSLLQAQQAGDAAARQFRALWNGRDLAGWHGQRQLDPAKVAALSVEERAKDDAEVATHWRIENGELVNDGHGAFLTTDQAFGDADYVLEYRTVALADSGIYLRGCPQVQIWDCTEAGGKWSAGADKGSGGLWNNQKHARFPPVVADKPFGEWNKLEIRQVGSLVWVKLNDKVTVDGVVMENYFDRTRPVPARGPMQLQTHGGEIRFRNLSVREIPANEANELLRRLGDDGFASIFNGSFEGWQGDLDSYEVVEDRIRCNPGKSGNLFTKASYGDFAVRLQFRLPPGGNNGLAIRYPGTGDPAYAGFEVQVLDDSAKNHATLKPWQYHGSVYGVVASERGYQRPVGEWNFEEVVVRGSHVTVTLNGVVIVDADIAGLPSQLGDKHTGRDRKDGFFGFCGHGDAVEFKDVRIKRLEGGGAAAAAEDPPTVRALKLDPGQAGLDSPSNVQVFADPAALTTGLEGQIRFKLTGGETTPEERRAFATKIATQLGSQVDFAKERIAWVAWSTGGPPDGKLLHETKGKDLVFFVQAPAETARGKRLYRANDFFAVPVNTKVTLEKGERPAK